MAEEDLVWSQRHSHELNSTTYGHFGTPTYHQESREWSFSRCDQHLHHDADDASDEGTNIGAGFLRRIPFFRTITETDDELLQNGGHANSSLLREHPDLASFLPNTKANERNESAYQAVAHSDSLIAWGSAVWLGLEGVDSGNLNVPVSARVVGAARDTLCLTCLVREQIDFVNDAGITQTVRVPSLAGKPRAYWTGQNPILQLCFSTQGTDGRADSFLCVRGATSTSVLEPLLRRNTSIELTGSNRSSLDPNLLVTIDSSSTGGASHAHAAFNPQNHRRLAIIDEEGNWSIWKISGRRSHTARLLYQARLKSFGKIFSWKGTKRPDKTGLYFDGWHKMVWTSSNGKDVDRLLVCNRQSIRLFSLNGEELCSVDPRLQIKKVFSYILDARPGPRINLCLILTTSKVLLYDIAQTEWKDIGTTRGPALVMAFPHHHNAADLSLQMTDLFVGGKLFLGLYTFTPQHIRMRQITLPSTAQDLYTVVSDPWSVVLPTVPHQGSILSIVLALSEATYSGEAFRLVQAVVQHENLGISTSIVADGLLDRSQDSDNGPCLLRLPPSRNLGLKSQRHVEDADDEGDMANFIVSDGEDSEMRSGVATPDTSKPENMPMVNMRELKYVDKVTEELRLLRTCGQQQRINIQDAQDLIDERILGAMTSNSVIHSRVILADLLEHDIKIEDVENDSEVLEQMIHQMAASSNGLKITVLCMSTSPSILSTYENMFRIFIAPLPSSVPDRFRVHGERQVRRIAPEQLTSSIAVEEASTEPATVPEEGQLVTGSSQATTYDSHNADAAQRGSQEVLSSHASPSRTGKEEPNMSQALSILQNARMRISSLTATTDMSYGILDHDTSSLSHLTSILAHLPASADDNPETYDYEMTAQSIIEAELSTEDRDSHANRRTQRKLDRARKLKYQGQTTEESSQIEPSRQPRSNQSSGAMRHDNQRMEALPIRTNGREFPGLNFARGVGQISSIHPLSDGHLPEPSSSQAIVHAPFTSTQPERGVFANRIGSESQSKVKKKKKRVAGF